MKPWRKFKDGGLVGEAQTTRGADGALVEVMRRLRRSIVFLAWVLIVLAVLQLLLASVDVPKLIKIKMKPKFTIEFNLDPTTEQDR